MSVPDWNGEIVYIFFIKFYNKDACGVMTQIMKPVLLQETRKRFSKVVSRSPALAKTHKKCKFKGQFFVEKCHLVGHVEPNKL